MSKDATISIVAPAETKSWLVAQAAAQDRSVSSLMRVIIDSYRAGVSSTAVPKHIACNVLASHQVQLDDFFVEKE